jgi:hypothetical protein
MSQIYEGEHRIIRLMDLRAISPNPSNPTQPVTSLTGDDEIRFAVVDPTTGLVISSAPATNDEDDWYGILQMPPVGERKRSFTIQAKATIGGYTKYFATQVMVHPVVEMS